MLRGFMGSILPRFYIVGLQLLSHTEMAVDAPVYISPDLLRLLVIPAFIYASILDFRYRVIYNEFWIPLIGLSFLVITWDIALVLLGVDPVNTDFLFNLSTSILIGPSVAFLLYSNGIIGGADMKAIAYLSVLFPEFPEVLSKSYVVYEGITPVFSITVLVNGLLISFLYRLYLVAHNINNNQFNKKVSRIKCIDKERVFNHSGELILDKNKKTKIKIDMIKSYLNWRGITIEEVIDNNNIHSKAIVSNDRPYKSNSIHPLNSSNAAELIQIPKSSRKDSVDGTNKNWFAEEYTDVVNEQNKSDQQIEPEKIEKAMEKLQEENRVWVTPSIPFFIPLTIGLLISIGFGSLYVAGIETAAQIVVEILTKTIYA